MQASGLVVQIAEVDGRGVAKQGVVVPAGRVLRGGARREDPAGERERKPQQHVPGDDGEHAAVYPIAGVPFAALPLLLKSFHELSIIR